MSIFCICACPVVLLPVVSKFNQLIEFFSKSMLFFKDFSFTAAHCDVTQ